MSLRQTFVVFVIGVGLLIVFQTHVVYFVPLRCGDQHLQLENKTLSQSQRSEILQNGFQAVFGLEDSYVYSAYFDHRYNFNMIKICFFEFKSNIGLSHTHTHTQ